MIGDDVCPQCKDELYKCPCCGQWFCQTCNLPLTLMAYGDKNKDLLKRLGVLK